MPETNFQPSAEDENLRRYDFCRICGGASNLLLASLVPTPPADHFLLPEDCHHSSETFPLEVRLCTDCGYVYLPWVLKPEILYPGFKYLSRTTVGLVDHYKEYVDWLQRYLDFESRPLCLDIGSNDGSFLFAAKSRGARVVGIEPGREVCERVDPALNTICGFFDASVAEQVLSHHGRPDLICANYVYANIENVVEFTKLVATCLAPGGIFVVQTGYHPAQMKKHMFDYVYHEHLSYFSVSVLRRLFEKSGLELISVDLNEMKGGSIRVVAQVTGGSRPVHESVTEICSEERENQIGNSSFYRTFQNEIIKRGRLIKVLLREIHAQGKTIVGYGASHSTTTLLHCFGISVFIEFLVDDNSLKHGTVSPGFHIPVLSPEALEGNRVDYLIVLGWQHSTTIVERNQCFPSVREGVIIPLPSLEVMAPARLTE